MKIENLTWFAGFFEGDGTTGLFKTRRKSGKWRISTYFLITNNDPTLIERCNDIAKDMGVDMFIIQRERPEGKDWNINYQIAAKSFTGVHTILKNILPHLVGNKRAIAKMTMRFIESRNFGKPNKGPGSSYSEEDWLLYDAVKEINQRGKNKKLEPPETIRQALGKIASDDMAQTSMKIGEEIPIS